MVSPKAAEDFCVEVASIQALGAEGFAYDAPKDSPKAPPKVSPKARAHHVGHMVLQSSSGRHLQPRGPNALISIWVQIAYGPIYKPI